jgi:FMN phosphatase YigB (HAD superfamily)
MPMIGYVRLGEDTECSLTLSTVKTLDALEITPLLTAGTTISQLAGFEKPDPRIFEAACRKAEIEPLEDADRRYDGVLMIGDELEA